MIKKYIVIFFIFFVNLLFANEEFKITFDILNYPNVLYFFIFSILFLFFLIILLFETSSFSSLTKSLKRTSLYLNYIFDHSKEKKILKKVKKVINNETFSKKNFYKSEIQKFKNELEYKNIEDKFNYFFLTTFENDSFICQKLENKDMQKNSLKKLNFLQNNYCKTYFYKIPISEFKINFYFNILSASRLAPYLNIKYLFAFFSLFSFFLTLLYFIWTNYFTQVILLVGILPNNIEINFYEFISYLFSNILILGGVPFISLIVSIIMGILFFSPILSILLSYIFSCTCFWNNDRFNSFFYNSIYASFISNILIYFTFLLILIYFTIETLFSIYKITYPDNNSIKSYNIKLYLTDYLKYTNKLSIVKVNNNFLYSVGYDKNFMYYYDIKKQKNIFLKRNVENSNDCKQILKNIDISNISKKEKEKIDLDWLKFKSILINNKILNTNFLKKIPLTNLLKDNKYEERNILYIKDFYINEIINKCEILVNLKNVKKVNYNNFEKFNNKELITWISSLKLNKETIKNIIPIKKRINLSIKKN